MYIGGEYGDDSSASNKLFCTKLRMTTYACMIDNIENESIEQAAIRELEEETGLVGQFRGINSNLLVNGHVVWITVPMSANPFSWKSNDDNILEVGWCLTPPEDLHWGVDELHSIANYWSNFATSGS